MAPMEKVSDEGGLKGETIQFQQLCQVAYFRSQNNKYTMLALFFSRIAWRREEALAAPVGAADEESFASGVPLVVVEEAALLSSRTFSVKTKTMRSAHRVQKPLVNVAIKGSLPGANGEMSIDDTNSASWGAAGSQSRR